MQNLNRSMMARYEIPEHIPTALAGVQFGADATLLGVTDRLIDDAGLNLGLVCVETGSDGLAARLAAQDGLFTLIVRGYRGEAPVKREQVVQCLTRCDASVEALALEPGLAIALIHVEAENPGFDPAARLLEARKSAGLKGLSFICLGESANCAETVREAIRAKSDLGDWLEAECAFYPALAEGLAFRAEADEAARLCGEMNYLDTMLHLSEPFAALTIQAPPAFRERWPLDSAEGVAFVDDLAPWLERKHRLWDAGLFAMTAPGWLLGCDTLRDCMAHERLRAFVGNCFTRELLPGTDAAEYVIRCFERFENPLNRNRLLRAGDHLLERFRRGALPVMRTWAEENFEPPRHLAYALAATIMLYAGARPKAETGQYEVARGRETQVIDDDPEKLSIFATLSHDMPPETLAYAALADRDLWNGDDLREIDGLEARVALDIAAMQRAPGMLPEE